MGYYHILLFFIFPGFPTGVCNPRSDSLEIYIGVAAQWSFQISPFDIQLQVDESFTGFFYGISSVLAILIIDINWFTIFVTTCWTESSGIYRENKK